MCHREGGTSQSCRFRLELSFSAALDATRPTTHRTLECSPAQTHTNNNTHTTALRAAPYTATKTSLHVLQCEQHLLQITSTATQVHRNVQP